MIQLYLLAGSIVLSGFVWFWIVRPIVVSIYDAYAAWSDDLPPPRRHQRHEPMAPRARPRLRLRLMSRPIKRTMPRTRVLAHEPRSFEIPLLNGAEPSLNGSENPAELALNADEVIAIGRMILHNRTAVKPSKSSTVAAGFGVSRGGSAAYIRASLIYDALFGAPERAVQYRELTPDRQQLLKQKGALN